MRLQSAYDNAAARIAKLNQDLGSSIWSNSASGNENARPMQPTAAVPSAPKSFSFNTSTATNNNVDTTSSTARGRVLPPHVQGAARAPSPALSASSATSSRADAATADMSNTAPRGPLLFNPQQAKLLRSDPDWQETRQSAAKPSRSRGPAVARSPAPPSAPRQSYMTSSSATPSRAPASNGPLQGNQMQKEEPRGRVTQPTNTFANAAGLRERINEVKPAAPAPAMPLSQATARDIGSMAGEEKALNIENSVNSTSGSIAAKPAIGLSQATSSSSSSSSGDKLVAAMKARMIQMDAELEAKKAKVETPAAPPAAPGPSTPPTAAAPVFLPPPASTAAKPAAVEPCAADDKADLMTKAAAVEKKAELDVSSPASKPKILPPHLLRSQAAAEKPVEPLKAEPKVQPKVEPKVEIMVEPKIEPKAEPKADIKAEIKTEPKLEPFAAAPKPSYTPKPTAMPTPATSPAPSSGEAAYAKRLGDFEAVAKQNPARAAMKWDELQEENTLLQELITFQQELEALAAKRIEMNAKIDAAMASKKECIARCLNTLSTIKQMRIEEEQLAKEAEAKLNRLKQEE